jgi:predicted nucleic acid-binding Zn ribbon protein
MSDEPHTVCPECEGEIKRQIGGGMGVIFRGSGFYVNDSRKKTSGSSKSSSSDSK